MCLSAVRLVGSAGSSRSVSGPFPTDEASRDKSGRRSVNRLTQRADEAVGRGRGRGEREKTEGTGKGRDDERERQTDARCAVHSSVRRNRFAAATHFSLRPTRTAAAAAAASTRTHTRHDVDSTASTRGTARGGTGQISSTGAAAADSAAIWIAALRVRVARC